MRHIRVPRTARYEMLGDDSSPREVWFVLHGYGQLAATFIRPFDVLDDGTRLIVAPEALNRFYVGSVDLAPAADRQVGATWMTREDRDEEIVDYIGYLDMLADRVLRAVRRGGRTPRVILLGFSQGAATATRWAIRGQVVPDHLVLWGGFVPPEIDLASPALHATSLHIFLGDRDRYTTEERVVAEERRLNDGGVPHQLVRYEGGHSLSRERLVAFAQAIAVPNA